MKSSRSNNSRSSNTPPAARRAPGHADEEEAAAEEEEVVVDATAGQHRDILVSIILSESTTSLLQLQLPNIEEWATVDQTTCIIPPVTHLSSLPPSAAIAATSTTQQRPHSSLYAYLFGDKDAERADESHDITAEIAFFSDHFAVESSTSNASLAHANDSDSDEDWFTPERVISDDNLIAEPMATNLNAQRVFVKPLLNAKTTAHENNISMAHNTILVNLLDDDGADTESTGSIELMCRICHGGDSVGDLLKPCRCRGTIALVHMDCLEHWLRESANSYCELCKHHFRIVRQPRVLRSILVYLTSPGENFRDVVLDLIAFVFYTPSAIATTYMLMVICENMAKAHLLNRTRNVSAQLVAFCAIFGMAAIDFTYSSWLILTCQRHAIAWRAWYRNNSYLRLLLPEHKKRAYRSHRRQAQQQEVEERTTTLEAGASASN